MSVGGGVEVECVSVGGDEVGVYECGRRSGGVSV